MAHTQRDSPGGSSKRRGKHTFPSEYYNKEGRTCFQLQHAQLQRQFYRVILSRDVAIEKKLRHAEVFRRCDRIAAVTSISPLVVGTLDVVARGILMTAVFVMSMSVAVFCAD